MVQTRPSQHVGRVLLLHRLLARSFIARFLCFATMNAAIIGFGWHQRLGVFPLASDGTPAAMIVAEIAVALGFLGAIVTMPTYRLDDHRAASSDRG